MDSKERVRRIYIQMAQFKNTASSSKISKECKTLEEAQRYVVDKLCAFLGDFSVIKIHQVVTSHNVVVWFLLHVDPHQLVEFILNLSWFSHHKRVKVFFDQTLMDLAWTETATFRLLKEFREKLYSSELWDYSAAQGTEFEALLPRFENVVGKVSDGKASKSSHHRPHHHKSKKHASHGKKAGKEEEHHHHHHPHDSKHPSHSHAHVSKKKKSHHSKKPSSKHLEKPTMVELPKIQETIVEPV